MNILKNVGLFLLFQVIAFLPSLGALCVDTGGWYAELYKPQWTPPDSIFGIVWTTLYVMIGLAGFFAWRKGTARTPDFVVYGVQLLLNGLWTLLFFGMHRIAWALGDLVLLWFLILACIGAFSQRRPIAAWLMIPYFLWVSFAGALNAAILVIN